MNCGGLRATVQFKWLLGIDSDEPHADRFEVSTRNGFFLRRNTPPAIIRKLHDATLTVISAPALQERLRQIGAEVVSPEGRSEDYLGKFVASEIKKWGIAIKAAGVTAE